MPKWQNIKACWEKLEKGDYDWAHGVQHLAQARGRSLQEGPLRRHRPQPGTPMPGRTNEGKGQAGGKER